MQTKENYHYVTEDDDNIMHRNAYHHIVDTAGKMPQKYALSRRVDTILLRTLT
jgi:hypothetical protein